MLEALPTALAPLNLFFATLGVIVGAIFGAIPGLTATLAIALFVPVTFAMEATHGLTMLGGIYAGAIFGGSISAILINVPGTPASIVTGWEGYAMARRGEAPFALGLAAVSSGVGGVLSAIVMLFLTPSLAQLALTFGPAEFVGLLLFSLAMVIVMMDTPLVQNATGCVLGLTIATVGLDPMQGTPRFTFGLAELSSGFNLVAVLIGFFCMTQALILAREAVAGEQKVNIEFEGAAAVWRVLRSVFTYPWTYLRSTTIGVFLGIMPAIGPESTPFMVHTLERKFGGADRAMFGKGSPRGLIAAETSISANVGGSLIPLFSLGIPGSGAAAMFLGALTLHGLRPGPLLFAEHGATIYGFLIAFIFVNVVMMLLGLFAIPYLAAVLLIPKSLIAAFVAFFSIFGSYAVNNSMFDVFVMFAATALAFVFRLLRIPILPLALGLILGTLLEENFVVFGITIDGLEALLARPVALAFFALTAVTLAVSFVTRSNAWRRGRSVQEAAALKFE